MSSLCFLNELLFCMIAHPGSKIPSCDPTQDSVGLCYLIVGWKSNRPLALYSTFDGLQTPFRAILAASKHVTVSSAADKSSPTVGACLSKNARRAQDEGTGSKYASHPHRTIIECGIYEADSVVVCRTLASRHLINRLSGSSNSCTVRSDSERSSTGAESAVQIR